MKICGVLLYAVPAPPPREAGIFITVGHRQASSHHQSRTMAVIRRIKDRLLSCIYEMQKYNILIARFCYIRHWQNHHRTV